MLLAARLRRIAMLCLLITPAAAAPAPSPFGYWRTENGGGVIAVTPCDGMLCARIAGIVLDHPDDAIPTDYRGQPECDLPLVTDAQETRPGFWRGHIMDPRSGRFYGVELHVDAEDRLAVHGFLGISLLGRTDYWVRYPDTPPADCRMSS